MKFSLLRLILMLNFSVLAPVCEKAHNQVSYAYMDLKVGTNYKPPVPVAQTALT